MPGLTHEVTLFQRKVSKKVRWECSCGAGSHAEPSASAAAQRFAEHYALSKQQEAPKVTRRAPEHDGGRTLTLDTVRKSEQAVLLALRLNAMSAAKAATDPVIAARAAMFESSIGKFSPSRLRTARVELQRAGLVEAEAVQVVSESGRKMRSYVLTATGWNMARELMEGPDA